MDDFLHDDELLMKYLDGELGGGEATNLHDRLLRDTALQEKLDTFRMAAESVRLFGIQQMVGEVRVQWEGQSTTRATARAKVISLRRAVIYGLSSVACIVLLVVGIRYLSEPHLSPDAIFRQTYVEFDLGKSRSATASLTPVEQAWQKKNYGAVVSIGSHASLSSLDQLLLGLSYLQLQQPAAAIAVFKTILAASDPGYQEDAAFYLGLSYLQTHNTQGALELLEKIQRDPNHLYHQQVSERTIREIKSLK